MFSSIGIFKEEIHLKVGEKRSQNNIKSKVRKKDKKYRKIKKTMNKQTWDKTKGMKRNCFGMSKEKGGRGDINKDDYIGIDFNGLFLV